MNTDHSENSGTGKEAISEGLQHLSDAPVDNDAFVGRAHERTAQALVQIMKTNNPAIRAIGLEGPWGSGKSSLINIALKDLDKEKSGTRKIHSFVFDLWAHQGDDLKRALLEKLVEWLGSGNKPLADKAQVKKWNESISAKTQIITSKTVPEFTPLGLFALFVAIFLPLIYAWLSPLAFANRLQGQVSLFDMNGIQIFFLILFLTPILWVLARWIGAGFSKDALNESVLAVARKSKRDQETKQIRDEDPTSVEFSRFLAEILAATTSADQQILIVMDNLDRLPDDQISDAWALMRTLLGREGDVNSGNGIANVWLVAPYDVAHLGKAFGENKQDTKQLIHGFVEKTFDVVLHVAPPILSDWQDYFDSQIQVAIPHLPTKNGEQSTQAHNLKRLLEYEMLDQAQRITPRSIKAYINDIVTIILQWEDAIPIECIALYVLKRRTSEDISILFQGLVLSPRSTNTLMAPFEWQRYVAALHYNVDPSAAYQVSIAPKLLDAVEKSDTKFLDQLAGNPGFDSVLADIVAGNAENWASRDADLFASVCATLSKTKRTGPAIAEAWAGLSNATNVLTSFKSISEEITEGLVALVENSPIWTLERMLTSLKTRLGGDMLFEMPTRNSEDGEAWFALIDRLDTCLVDHHQLEGQFVGLTVPGTGPFVLGVVEASIDAKTTNLEKLEISASKEDITESFTRRLNGPLVPANLAGLLRHALNRDVQIDLNAIPPVVVNRLTENTDDIDDRSISSLIQVLLSQIWTKSFAEAATTLSENGTFPALCHKATGEEDEALRSIAVLAACIGTEGGDMPQNVNHPVFGETTEFVNATNSVISDSSEEEELVSECATLARKYNLATELIRIAKQQNNPNGLPVLILTEMIENNLIKGLNISTAVSNFDTLASLFDTTILHKFAASLDRWAGYIKETDLDNTTQLLIKTLYDCGSDDLLNKIIELASERFKDLSEEQWTEALDKQNKNLELLIAATETKGIKLPAGPFKDALFHHAKRLLKGQAGVGSYDGKWKLLPQCLHGATRKAFYRDIATWLKGEAITAAEIRQLFSYFPEFASLTWSSELGDMIARSILAPLLTDAHSSNLGILTNNKDFFKQAYADSSEETIEYVNDAFAGALQSRPEEDREKVLEFADFVGAAIPSPPIETDEQSDT